MKRKILVAVAAAGLSVAPLSFASTGVEGMDDTSSAGMQNLAMDNSNAAATMQNPGADNPSATGPNMASVGTGSATSPMDAGNANSTANANDDMSADTATGDDDY